MSGIEAVTGKALPLPLDDVDTDVIYPALFLLHTEKKGLAMSTSDLTAAKASLIGHAGATFRGSRKLTISKPILAWMLY